MADQQVELSSEATSLPPLDHKRKLQELEPETISQSSDHQPQSDSLNKSGETEYENDEEARADFSEAKRPRVDEKADGLVGANGFKAGTKEDSVNEIATEQNIGSEQREELLPPSMESHETIVNEQSGAENFHTVDEQPAAENFQAVDEQSAAENLQTEVDQTAAESLQAEDEQPAEENLQTTNIQKASGDGSESPLKLDADEPSEKISKQDGHASATKVQSTDGGETITRLMEVPNNKVGVLIGKSGDTIRLLQNNSGAKIQITRDVAADPSASTRPVELVGTSSSIEKAENLIKAVIAEAEAGGSPSLVARGHPCVQATVQEDQIEMQVPNEKVGLIIGRGGDTIKGLQNRSGARIQLIPQHLSDGNGSKERIVRVTGSKKKIESAREMIKEVMNQTVRPPPSNTYNQKSYRSPGPNVPPPQWGSRASDGSHSSYDYHQRGPYQSQFQHPSYGSYHPQQFASRTNFSSGWEQQQRPHFSGMQGQPPQGGAYDYYGGQGTRFSDQVSQVSNPISQGNYNYSHPPPYSQMGPTHQSYDNQAPPAQQHSYGHGTQPTYPQSGFIADQHYGGKPPSYGMPPPQAPVQQSQGPPRPVQLTETSYQGAVLPTQPYGATNVQQQQQYPYAAGAQMQQAYPSYGTAPPAADGYNNNNNQVLATSGQGYPMQAGYGQPGQQAGAAAAAYGQVVPGGVYVQYPYSQQGYTEQPVPTNAAGYGYQDQSYGVAAAAGTTYSAAPSGQPTTAYAQPGQDQSQSGGYAVVASQASAPAVYAKTVSPQPAAYPPPFDSTQMYAAPH